VRPLLLLLIATLSCQRSPPPVRVPDAPAGAPAAPAVSDAGPPDAPIAAAVVDAAPAPAPAPAASDDPWLRQVPPFEAPSPSAPEADLAFSATTDNLDPYNRQESDDRVAPGVAIEAVVAAPASVQARYLLACTLAARKLHSQAHAVLQPLRAAAASCPRCADALLNAAADTECGFDHDAAAIAAALPPSPVRTATMAVLSSLNSGDAGAAMPYLDRAREVTFAMSGEECDVDCDWTTKYSRAALIQYIRGAEQRAAQDTAYVSPARWFCDDRCCRGPNPSHSHAPLVHVTEVCFTTGPDPKLVSLTGGVDG
jgi:hypothetical protein